MQTHTEKPPAITMDELGRTLMVYLPDSLVEERDIVMDYYELGEATPDKVLLRKVGTKVGKEAGRKFMPYKKNPKMRVITLWANRKDLLPSLRYAVAEPCFLMNGDIEVLPVRKVAEPDASEVAMTVAETMPEERVEVSADVSTADKTEWGPGRMPEYVSVSHSGDALIVCLYEERDPGKEWMRRDWELVHANATEAVMRAVTHRRFKWSTRPDESGRHTIRLEHGGGDHLRIKFSDVVAVHHSGDMLRVEYREHVGKKKRRSPYTVRMKVAPEPQPQVQEPPQKVRIVRAMSADDARRAKDDLNQFLDLNPTAELILRDGRLRLVL